jgi:glucose/arabinose dehydrogenase
VLVIALVLLVLPSSAQRQPPFVDSVLISPPGVPPPPLPAESMTIPTAEGHDIRVVVVARGLSHPWSLAFLPEGGILVTERGGRLRVMENGRLSPDPIAGVPEVFAEGTAGLMDVALHPRFVENRLVYFTYSKPIGAHRSTLALARGRLDHRTLTDVRDVFVTRPDISGGSRIVFGRDGALFMTTGAGGGIAAQDPGNYGGKVLRLTEDGGVPPDNPFVGRAGYKPEVYTLGHRNSLGLAVHPVNGQVWQNENGPNGGDEINVLEPGRNYGWPLVSYGRTYAGPRQSEQPWRAEFEQPTVFWVPSISVSGMAFYTGSRFEKWTGNVFVGGLRTGGIPGTGHLERLVFNRQMEEIRRESLLGELRRRMRDVRQGPDGLLYCLTDDEQDAALLRLEPIS